jgi:hypothetical protein
MSNPDNGEVLHRLRNHLAVIVGFCDLLLSECPEGDVRRGDLVEVHKAARAAMAMLPEVERRAAGHG